MFLCNLSLFSQEDGNDGSFEPLFEAGLTDFGDAAYKKTVEALLHQWELRNGNSIRPGEKGRVGLKIYTSSGPGLATPEGLVKAVISALEKRGYDEDSIFIMDVNEVWIRESGFLPPLSRRKNHYEGLQVCAINSGKYFDPVWYYDSPVPPREHHLPGITPMVQEFVDPSLSKEKRVMNDRRSYLPAPLLQDVDFWINLPVVSDHEILGLNGALVNATLWNASNTLRFFHSPANAPVAVAEMAAIPEFQATWEMTFVSLERYQYIGGPRFNSYYTKSEKLVVLSSDPVAVDSYMVDKINQQRKRMRFPRIENGYAMLEYAEALGVGHRNIDSERLIHLKVR